MCVNLHWLSVSGLFYYEDLLPALGRVFLSDLGGQDPDVIQLQKAGTNSWVGAVSKGVLLGTLLLALLPQLFKVNGF